METQSFIYQRFAEFYEEKAADIQAPPSIEQREFGFLIFKGNIMIRHRGFATEEALRSGIRQIVPSHAYYSTAYYEQPEEKMESKGWLGADLYFDIDADHIPAECGRVHDTWTCKDCGFAGKGVAPEKCPMCGKKRYVARTWPCEVCLESTKTEMMKLVDMLTQDFGFSSGEVEVSFSGHRGYHVHVEDEVIRELDSVARKEVVDYITGVGLDATFHGLETRASSRSTPLSGSAMKDVGWRDRIAKGAREFLLNATEDDLKSIGLREKTIGEIASKKDAILESWERVGPWRPIKGVAKEELKKIISRVVENQSSRIDTVVTTDIHRLIRLPNSLHGKTGLLKIVFPVSEIEGFDPLKRAVAFKKGEATIYVEEAPELRLGEERFGPFKGQKVELPMAAALFLLCKGAAKMVD
ncbi:MAG: DNA primase small subunit PriS [Candidatus Bathyarchaeota archaeon]|nr:DNA primase small subunit PriS [Candidatus Bathyarchaeota archaeon]